MYADRYGRTGFNPGSLGLAIAINGAVVATLLVAAGPQFTPAAKDPPLTTYWVPIDPPPEPIPPKTPDIAKPRQSQITAPKTIIPTEHTEDFVAPDLPPIPPPITEGTIGTGGAAIDPPKPPPPVVVAPGLDPRYTADLQPSYPAEERRAGREGRVVVRVLVGTDGRVKQVELVSTASDAFFRATRDRALTRWRFKPGLRDGVPVEAWRIMALSFRLED